MIHSIWHAVGVFWDHLADLGWGALGLGVVCHVLRLLCVSTAWRNIIQAAYPKVPVPRKAIMGAVFAGVGVSAIIPARGGDAARVFLAKRVVPHSTYVTITSTVVLLSLFDFVVAGSLVLWAAASGSLPGGGVLGPSFDFGWVIHNPITFLKVVALVLIILLVIVLWFAEQIGDFRRRIAQGFSILRDKQAYLRGVAAWQTADWLLRFAAIFFFLHAFGLPATLHNAVLVQVSAALASLLPISPSGIGTEQAFLVYLFRGHVPGAALVAFSVGMRLTLIAVNTALGFATLLVTLRTVRWREAHGAHSRN
ncbi:MAG TPA: lysylphosphatidylglycerol synthase transmembrane domain-containing protein [Gaiellaceae bacterium]|nr:lysylphosphatidylglycerol synthase transmembrane domain-containing protein [Gaiellaceae bacterium]